MFEQQCMGIHSSDAWSRTAAALRVLMCNGERKRAAEHFFAGVMSHRRGGQRFSPSHFAACFITSQPASAVSGQPFD